MDSSQIRTRNWLVLCFLVAGAWALPLLAAEPAPVVILGFDGVDAKLTERWMDEGQLPNLAKLRDQGTFSPLRSTVPSQTPVSWSTFSTGLDPGRHSIFDFLKRDPETYVPGFAAFDQGKEPFLWGERTPLILGLGCAVVLLLLVFALLKLLRRSTRLALAAALVLAITGGVVSNVAAARYLPKEQPIAINRQQGDTFWEVLGAAGKKVKVVRVPVTFPPTPFEHGELLTGLGTPDMSLRIGKPFYFTSELFFQPKGGGDFSIEVVELIDNRGEIPTEIKGPPNELFPDLERYIKIPMTLTVAEDRSKLSIELPDSSLDLRPGEWSDWQHFTFPFNPLVKLYGIGRFRLLSIDPEVRLYLSPINFDPERLPPNLQITTPKKFVDRLTSRFGLFKTMGWSVDTWSMNEGTLDEAAFLEDIDFTVDKYQEILNGHLDDADWDLMVHYFEFPDRVQHMMWRFFDEQHPLYDAEEAAKWGGSILESYQRMDEIVGETLSRMPENAMLMVVSDHGFASFRRGMNYNTWLAKNGYMTLTGEDADRKNLEDLFDKGDFFVNVDWSQTRAYALGLGQIYINLKGREGQGVVEPGAEYEALVVELKAGLEAFVDEQTGEHPVAYVWTRDEIYGQYDPQLIPDLIPSNAAGYRVGWQDALGGIGKAIVEENESIWSGDHCSVYPPLVNGILFSNSPLVGEAPYMADIMPTLLQHFGVTSATEFDGSSLLPGS